MEADAFPVVWLARVRCVAFWFKVLSSPLYGGRILRGAALEAMECGGSWDYETVGVSQVFWVVWCWS